MKTLPNAAPLALAVALTLATGTAIAATSVASNSDYQSALNAILQDPANPETSFKFVKVAVAAGDYRGAISALERILKINPGLSNIRLELGVLYHRVGANELAKGYINQALQDPSIPANIRNRAKALLAQAEDASSKHLFSGNIALAVLHDDNANAGPSSRTMIVNGAEVDISEASLPQEDSSVELVAGLQYAYTLSGQRGNRVEADLISYNRIYSDFSNLDTNIVDFSLGPRFHFGELMQPKVSIRPYLSAGTTKLDGDDYKDGLGAGINIRKPLALRTLGEINLEVEDQDYHNSESRPNAALRSGTYSTLTGRVIHQISPRTRFAANILAGQRTSDEDFESLSEVGAGLSLRRAYSFSENIQSRPWSTTFSLNLKQTDYDEADTGNGINEAREERRTSAGISTDIPLADSLSMIFAVSYTENDSNVALYDYDNWGASLGVSYGF